MENIERIKKISKVDYFIDYKWSNIKINNLSSRELKYWESLCN